MAEQLAVKLQNLQVAENHGFEIAKRPEKSPNAGKNVVKLRANWFHLLAANFEDRIVYKYQVKFYKVKQRRKKGKDNRYQDVEERLEMKHKDELRALFWTMVRDFPQVFHKVHMNVFDDFYFAYCMHQWKLPERKTTILSENEEDRSRIEVDIEPIGPLCLTLPQRFDENPYDATMAERVNETTRFLKFLFSQRIRYSPVHDSEEEWNFIRRWEYCNNASFRIPKDQPKLKIELINGVEAWWGIRAALKQLDTSEPMLNYGLVTNLFYKVNLDLITYFSLSLQRKDRETDEGLSAREWLLQHPEVAIPEKQRRKMEYALNGLKIQTQFALVPIRNTNPVRFEVLPRHGTFAGLEDRAANVTFIPKAKTNIVNLYRECYRKENDNFVPTFIPIEYPYLPCVKLLSGKKEVLVPLELVEVHEKPQRYNKLLGYDERKRLVQKTTLTPTEHADRTNKYVKNLKLKDDEFITKFGLNFDPVMLTCEGRVLDPPQLLDYKGMPIEYTDQKEINHSKTLRLSVPVEGEIGFALIPIRDPETGEPCVREGEMRTFYNKLLMISRERGLDVGGDDRFLWFCEGVYTKPRRQELSIHDAYNAANEKFKTKQKENPSLAHLFCITFSDHALDNYGEIKHCFDTVYGVANTVVNKKTVEKTLNETCQSPLYQITLKINAKLGGQNQIPSGYSMSVESQPPSPDEPDADHFVPPTMFIGIDVTHSTNLQDNYKKVRTVNQPRAPLPAISIASMVGSFNLSGTLYTNQILAQMQARETIEIFDGQKFPKLVNKFLDTTGKVPERVIIYRDGVSDSEMINTASNELRTIKREWQSVIHGFDKQTMPKFTYIVVQKRHGTRFYKPVEKQETDENREDEYENMPPGTVVDSGPVKATLFDFFLASHFGALGTTRPAHYTVVYDESHLSRDEIYAMTYQLCFLYMRTRKPVSLPAPVYYAHLVCEKAKEVYKIIDIHQIERHELKEHIERELMVHENYPGMHFI